jgi:hypothetical protein
MVKLLLTNRSGGFALLADAPTSRFDGVFFKRNDVMFKAIENITSSVPAARTTNNLWCVERQRGMVTERILMPEGRDGLIVELSSPMELALVLDCKRIHDNRVWGRNYEVTAEKGCVVCSYTKRNDHRDGDNKDGEYDVHVAACANPLDYMPVKQWEEHHYMLDETRHSPPFSRWVYVAAKLKCSTVAFGFGLTKNEAVRTARELLASAARTMRKEQERVAQEAKARLCEPTFDVARKCCVHALDALTVDDTYLYAGLPWFFQPWVRDELVSVRGLLLAGREELAKRIVLKYLDRLKGTRLASVEGGDLMAADAPGWLFLRCEDLLLHEEANRTGIVTRRHVALIAEAVTDYLDALAPLVKDSLVKNGPLETWMDTSWDGDNRAGSRIEVQALTLAACRLYRKLNAEPHELEAPLLAAVRARLRKGNVLLDGQGDATARPNAFIALYACPELFSEKEWRDGIKELLPKLWLGWGGLSTIDKRHKLFSPHYTGENNKSYHRGDSWFWLNNIAAVAMHRLDAAAFREQVHKILGAGVKETLHMGASGFSAELSSAEELRAEGCIAQAWSSATLLELLDELGMGEKCDLPSITKHGNVTEKAARKAKHRKRGK